MEMDERAKTPEWMLLLESKKKKVSMQLKVHKQCACKIYVIYALRAIDHLAATKVKEANTFSVIMYKI